MRVVWLAVLACGCGRIGFDANTDGAAGSATYYLISTPSSGTTPMTTLFTVDLATGQLTAVGAFPATFGVLGGLASWDSNTLYATSNTPGIVVEITLSPFSATQVATYSGGIASLARVADMVVGCDDSTNRIMTFVPGSAVTTGPALHDPANMPLGSNGGDIAVMNDGTVLWFTNGPPTQLYQLDVSLGLATPIGTQPSVPYIAGMVRDETDRLFLSSSAGDDLIEIDPSTGALGAATRLCLTCPTTFDLQGGDAARTP